MGTATKTREIGDMEIRNKEEREREPGTGTSKVGYRSLRCDRRDKATQGTRRSGEGRGLKRAGDEA